MDIGKINDGLFYQVGQKAQPKKDEELLWARVSNGKAVKGDSFSQKIGNTSAKNGSITDGKTRAGGDSGTDVEEALQDFYRGQMFGMSGLTGGSNFSMNSGDIGMMRYAMQQGNGKLMSALLGEQNMGSLLNFFR